MKQSALSEGTVAKVIVRVKDKSSNIPVISKLNLLEPPTIYGNFNNWRGQQMLKIEDYAFLCGENSNIDRILDKMKLREECSEKIEHPNELTTEKEIVDYNYYYHTNSLENYGTRKAWRNILSRSSFFKEPCLVNLDKVCHKK